MRAPCLARFWRTPTSPASLVSTASTAGSGFAASCPQRPDFHLGVYPLPSANQERRGCDRPEPQHPRCGQTTFQNCIVLSPLGHLSACLTTGSGPAFSGSCPDDIYHDTRSPVHHHYVVWAAVSVPSPSGACCATHSVYSPARSATWKSQLRNALAHSPWWPATPFARPPAVPATPPVTLRSLRARWPASSSTLRRHWRVPDAGLPAPATSSRPASGPPRSPASLARPRPQASEKGGTHASPPGTSRARSCATPRPGAGTAWTPGLPSLRTPTGAGAMP
mmetsp:Transcript_62731/g.178145  ORF Transcript_62731/g.178145 Transcript_62731/m.178145 type:complete len:279 (+) Transcript_62731:1494-2330(+)